MTTIDKKVGSTSPAFVPPDFKVPAVLETGRFRLRMLTVDDVAKDYEAVMSSAEHLRGIFVEHDTWPAADMTLKEDLKDLKWHQKQFKERKSFTYTVMTLDESRCLGCVYIFPPKKPGHDAVVYLWARTSELKNGLEEELSKTVKEWIKKEWPFKNVAYPGRDIPWSKWGEKTFTLE